MKNLRPSRAGSPAAALSSQGVVAGTLFTCKTQRGHDERKLDWVRRRCAGETLAQIAKAYGTCPSYVSRAINAIRDADVMTAPDAEGAYW